jgi:hypothetical protein
MTNYTVRIELHDADDEDYTDLHTAMEKKGFIRWIKDSGGSKSRLPTAEYNMADSALDRSEILNRAKAVADSVKPNPAPWILVTQSAGRSWSGLKAWKD